MDDLISLCYAGAEDSTHWKDFLAALSRRFGFLWTSFRLLDLRHQEPLLELIGGPSEIERREYLTKWLHDDPWAQNLNYRELTVGVIYAPQQLVDEATAQQTKAYREFFEPRKVEIGGGVVVIRDSNKAATLSFFRQRGQGAITSSEWQMMEPIIPHLQRALRLYASRLSLQQRHDAALTQIDELPHGVVLLDSDSNVVVANGAARQVIGAGQAARITRERFRFADPAADQLLQAALAHFRAGQWPDETIARRFVLPVKGRRHYLFLLSPLQPGQLVASGGPVASLLVVNPEAKLNLNPASLSELFGLTPTQGRIASLLATGSSVFEIAAELEIKASTVRSHLKHVFEKTNTERQAQLVLLLSRFASWKAE